MGGPEYGTPCVPDKVLEVTTSSLSIITPPVIPFLIPEAPTQRYQPRPLPCHHGEIKVFTSLSLAVPLAVPRQLLFILHYCPLPISQFNHDLHSM
jgi:hypothetical protein